MFLDRDTGRGENNSAVVGEHLCALLHMGMAGRKIVPRREANLIHIST